MPLTDEQLAAGITDEELAQDEAAIQGRIAQLTANLNASQGALAQVVMQRKRLQERLLAEAREAADVEAPAKPAPRRRATKVGAAS